MEHQRVANKCLFNWIETKHLYYIILTILLNDAIKNWILDLVSWRIPLGRWHLWVKRNNRRKDTFINESDVSVFPFLVSEGFYFFPILSEDNPFNSSWHFFSPSASFCLPYLGFRRNKHSGFYFASSSSSPTGNPPKTKIHRHIGQSCAT